MADDQHQWPLDAPLPEIRQQITDDWAESDSQEIKRLQKIISEGKQ